MNAGSERFVTNDPRLLEALDLIHQVAGTDATVLLIGETGTGKELVAQMLHARSARRDRPLIAINCGAISDTLQESELFGHRKGAFTGAVENRTGRFQAADGGTIFLDEISEMSKSLQVKLLRILQSGEFSPVGVSGTQHCDVRVVAASNEQLQTLIDEGRFRQDLYYRLNIIRVELPPLRERRSDIPLLVSDFVRRYGAQHRKPRLKVAPQAERLLLEYDYPGNVRELQNIVQRAVILCRDRVIAAQHLPPELSSVGACVNTTLPMRFHTAKQSVVEEFERAFLTSILSVCHGVISRAAQRSGLSERNFHAKLKKYGISSQAFRRQ